MFANAGTAFGDVPTVVNYAQVSVLNTATGARRDALSDDDGNYYH